VSTSSPVKYLGNYSREPTTLDRWHPRDLPKLFEV
jgi:hypothetical protein